MRNFNIRLITCGGANHNISHILHALSAYTGSELHNIVIDGTSHSGEKHLPSSLESMLSYEYYHMPGLSFTERLLKIAPKIIDAYSVTLTAVDDLIMDEGILSILNLNNTKNPYTNKLIYGFGPDINYLNPVGLNSSVLCCLPKTLASTGSVVPPDIYWQNLAKALNDTSGPSCLMKVINEVGFFPFVYSTYKSSGLVAIVEAHHAGMKTFNDININSKAGILFEYLLCSVCILTEKIHMTDIPYRFANYSCSSEGSTSSYSHRTPIGDLKDQNSNLLYFKAATESLLIYHGLSVCPYVLSSGFLSLSMYSSGLQNLENSSTANLLNPRSSYQRESLRSAFARIQSMSTLDMIRKMIRRPAND